MSNLPTTPTYAEERRRDRVARAREMLDEAKATGVDSTRIWQVLGGLEYHLEALLELLDEEVSA